MVFRLSNNGRIKLSDNAITIMHQYRQDDEKLNESGGVLLGRFIRESKDIIIDEVTTPMHGDKQTRYTFKRLSPLHQVIINERWIKCSGTCNYLGEWHTHPEDDPEPSGVDIKDWKRKLKKDQFSSRYLYFIIVGIKKVNVWEADRRTLEIKKLLEI